MFNTPVPETVRECLRAGGFRWADGKIYVPDIATKALKRLAQTDETLERPFNTTDHTFAIDPDAVFVVARVCHIFPLPIMLPIRIQRNATEFLDVDLKNIVFSRLMQSIIDSEGVFYGQGEVVQTTTIKRLAHAFPSARDPIHVVGARLLGVYIASSTQERALDCYAEIMHQTIKQEMTRRLLFGTEAEQLSVGTAMFADLRKELLESTKD